MTATVEEVLARLAAEGLLSDARFAETYVCSRVQRGCGPLRIRDELRARGVDQALIDDRLHAFDDRWREQIERVRSKRFGPAMPVDFRERARQMRFLQQRGFTPEQIHDLLGD
jgi:regulatory protein